MKLFLYLTRISHTFSEKIAAMAPEIPLQDSEDSVKLIRSRYPEGEDRMAEYASFPRKCEKCGLIPMFFEVFSISFGAAFLNSGQAL